MKVEALYNDYTYTHTHALDCSQMDFEMMPVTKGKNRVFFHNWLAYLYVLNEKRVPSPELDRSSRRRPKARRAKKRS